MIRPADQPLSARDVCRILFRHRRKSLLLFVTVVGLAVAGILLMPRKYASEAKLYVKLSLRLDPTATDEGQILAMTPEREEEMRSVVALLGSRSLYEQVVDQLGAATVLETKLQTSPLDLAMQYALSTLPQLGAEDTKAVREKAIRHLVKTIRIDNPKKSHVINLEYKSRSATLAQQVLDAYVRACLRLHLDIIKNPGAYQFFVQQEELLREQVLAAKQELRDLKNQVGLVSVDGQRQVLEQHIISLDREVLSSQTTLAATDDRIQQLRSQLPEELREVGSASALSNKSIDDMRNQLYTLEIRYRDVLARNHADHPQVMAMREQVEQAHHVLGREQLLFEISNAATLRSRMTALQADYKVTLDKLRQMNEDEVRVLELERRVEELAASHRGYVKKLEQSRLDQQLQSDQLSNLRLAEAPTVMGKALSRQGALIAALAVAVALLGAIGIAYVSDLLDERLATPGDIETSLNLPVLMSLPQSRAHRVSWN